jgi:hypothetical protein
MSHSTTRRRAFIGIAALLLLGALSYAIAWRHGREREVPSDPPSFDGESTQLRETQIVATLDTPIEAGKNVVWCAPFQLAWKEMQTGVVKGPLQIQGAGGACDRLNNAPDPSPDLPAGSFYAAAGRVGDGILAKIEKELKAAFPGAATPKFPDTAADSCVAYAYLKTGLQFPLPYFEDAHALAFVDGAGKRAPVRAFGIRREDDYAYPELRKQLKVLYASRDDEFEPPNGAFWSGVGEFVIDLCRDSEPNQVVIARVSREETLARTLEAIEKKIAAAPPSPNSWGKGELGPNDVLLVPKIQWHVVHHFKEFEGHRVTNGNLAGRPVALAMEEIRFSLDRGGVELEAQAKHHVRPVPNYYLANRPFLVYVKKRGAERPFFALWVENGELLTHTSAPYDDQGAGR